MRFGPQPQKSGPLLCGLGPNRSVLRQAPPLVQRGDRGSGLGLDAALGVRAVQVGRTDLAVTEQLEALLEDVLELLLGAALEQHVPVGADRLLRLLLAEDPGRAQSLGAAARALPDG